ncbi:lipopolysaccharide export system protein LptA [Dysgonomonas sp. PH5-45]|uniref:OstA-like protein n=1 Tax=unclassified Dysgonomonas TaxID=2630389 RepID=UPI002474CA71|nr:MULTISPECIES: OstA-like protein [unclassified Dysgonomonas]MDH6355333.1 lipopolysaccharide export system protein LptA [Dysgonomonas sp. PH5-45]MDH6388231.1 lipopolysaccharide export system protein LptA [Dysgonomonas sp. PH5-37]
MLKQQYKGLNKRHRFRILGFLCLLILCVSIQALIQTSPQIPIKPVAPVAPANKKLIKHKADSLLLREGFPPIILLYNVVLAHEGVVMNCDSAYLDRENNTFEAFGDIKATQGDTLFMYGKYLHYDANTQLLKIRRDVRLENARDLVLMTDSLNYDRLANFCYYFDGGVVVDSVNELTSFWGQYEPALHLITFNDSVRLTNPRFVLRSDTLMYHTETKIATIMGPSVIESDSGTIYTNRGWYNTITDESLLLGRSLIVNKEGNMTLTGDSIFYNKREGFGEVFGNVFMQDTTKRVILGGDYVFYNELTDFAFATDSAYCIEYSQGDSLYLHGDTLKLVTDSVYRKMHAYNNVRFFRSDIQGVCDSMFFSTKDSVLYLYDDPVLWNESFQLSGDTVEVYMNDSTIRKALVKESCFGIEQIDSLHFNQLKGNLITVNFDEGNIHDILVEGNAESIYFTKEKSGSLLRNRTESSFLLLEFKEKKFDRGRAWGGDSNGEIGPLHLFDSSAFRLRNFQWFDYLRPLNKDDIFRRVRKKSGSEQPRISGKFRDTDND